MTGIKIKIWVAAVEVLALSARAAPAQVGVPGGWEAGFGYQPARGSGFGPPAYGYWGGQAPPTFVRGPMPGFHYAAASTANQLAPFAQGFDRSFRPSRRGR